MGSELIRKVKYDTMPIVADELKVLLVSRNFKLLIYVTQCKGDKMPRCRVPHHMLYKYGLSIPQHMT